MTLKDASTIVVGAGPAGLAVGACLRKRGIEPSIFDRGGFVGQSWAERYDRLHLHTPRIQSHLPGFRIPRAMGRWVARDDMVRYLQSYVEHHGLHVEHGVEVSRVDRSSQIGYDIHTEGRGTSHARFVVIATGYNHEPLVPEWPGLDRFEGKFLHSSRYRAGSAFADEDVLVVGTGNTGAEIAADLAEQGARRVRLSIRTPPNIIPREIGPLPMTLLGIPNDFLPSRLTDPLNGLVQRVTIGDLSRYGMPQSKEGIVAQMRRTDVVPIIDVGLVEQLRSQRVEPVAAVAAFHGRDVELADGERIRPGVVIAATGYETALDSMVGHLGLVDGGRPIVHGGRTSPKAPGIYFVGLSNPIKGLLLQINLDARAAARAIARSARRQSSISRSNG